MSANTSSPESQRPFFAIFTGVATVLSILMPLLSQAYAITWDEWADSNYGFLVLKYILSVGENTSYTNFWHGYIYSGFFFSLTGILGGLVFDTIPHFVAEGFYATKNIFGFFQLSHCVNALFGFYLFFFTGLCAKEVKGWRAACLALVLIALSPRIFAHSMNNPKDIPFATTYMMAAYLMIRFFKQMPRPSWFSMFSLAVAIGLCIGCRVGGVILIGYLFSFGTLIFFQQRSSQKESVPYFPWFSRLVIPALYGYLLGLLFWPYGQINPFGNVFSALSLLSDFQFSGGQTLFQGQLISITELPWNYLPVWILITTPSAVIAGWLLFCVLLPRIQKEPQKKFILFLALLALFPILVIIIKNAVVYNDWRHLYFTCGPLAVLAALGWDGCFDLCRSRKIRRSVGVIFLVMATLPLVWMIRNHPYQALYFNEIEGGLKSAAGRYEIDYWGNTLRTAAEWISDYHLRHFRDQPASVRADGHIMSTYPIFLEKLGSRYSPYLYPDQHLDSLLTRYRHVHYSQYAPPNEDWDYGIILLGQQTTREIQQGKWPPSNTLFEVKVDGVTVCAVTKNPNSPLFKMKS